MNEALTSSIKDDDVIYTLRTAHQNQVQLIQMADQKANILIGLIVIPLSLLATRIIQLELDQLQLISVALISTLELIAVSMSIMVIRPRTMWVNHDMSIEQIPNPLFFGFFTRFSEDEYIGYMHKQLVSNRMAREMLLKDIYQIGQVLARKFRLLKFAYFFAASGMLFAVTAFLYFLSAG